MIMLISGRATALSDVKNKKQEGALYVLLVFAFRNLSKFENRCNDFTY